MGFSLRLADVLASFVLLSLSVGSSQEVHGVERRH